MATSLYLYCGSHMALSLKYLDKCLLATIAVLARFNICGQVQLNASSWYWPVYFSLVNVDLSILQNLESSVVSQPIKCSVQPPRNKLRANCRHNARHVARGLALLCLSYNTVARKKTQQAKSSQRRSYLCETQSASE